VPCCFCTLKFSPLFFLAEAAAFFKTLYVLDDISCAILNTPFLYEQFYKITVSV
jgi:hypothetical protein